MFLSPGSRARSPSKQREVGYTLGATVSGNIVTFTLSPAPGCNPYLEFRDPAIGSGRPYSRPITGTQFRFSDSFGSVLGSVPFRIWLVGIDTGGGVALGGICCVSYSGTLPTGTFALDETLLITTTGGLTGSTSGTFYCNQALTSRPFRILGYVEWNAGVTTLWGSAPGKLQLFGPGVKKPGDLIKSAYMSTNVGTSSSLNTFVASAVTISIAPTSSANLIRFFWSASSYNRSSSAAVEMFTTCFRNGTQQLGPIHDIWGQANQMVAASTGFYYDGPGTTSSTTYAIYFRNNDGVTNCSIPPTSSNIGSIIVEEIMA